MSKYDKPAVSGTTASYVTAEKVESPPQKPGSKKKRSSLIPRRSIVTKKKTAKATASRFAASVPLLLCGITKESSQRVSEPRTPPSVTSQSAFSVSCAFLA